MLLRTVLVTAAAVASSFALAQEQIVDDPFWGGSIDFGFISTSGNSDTQTLNFAFDFGRDGPMWRHSLHLEAYNNASEGEQTAEKYLGSWQSDLKFNERQSMFFRAQYEEDRFSNYSNQGSLSVGYGHRLLDQEIFILDLNAGPGYRRSKVQDTGEIEEDAILRLAADFLWQISPTAAFSQALSVEEGSTNTVARSATAISVSITEALALKVAYSVRWTREVEATFDNWDRESTVSVVYRW